LILNLTMNKQTVHQLILDKLRVDLDIAERAAQTAYETATHEENIAENKYDTLGLEDEKGREQWLFLAPDAAGLKVDLVGQLITVITPRSPLGKSLLGKFEGDEVEILVAGARQQFAVTEVI